MSSKLTRRTLLAALAATTAAPPLWGSEVTASKRPVPRPVGKFGNPSQRADALIRAAGLGGTVSYAVIDVKTGALLESRFPAEPQPPASTAKAITALYALDRLGPDHQFSTQLRTTGPIENGLLNGDLILVGGGDPTLDSDALGGLAQTLKEAGLASITGRFLYCDTAFPRIERIDTDQPDHVSYNPAISGLNLNYNRIHFEWEPAKEGFDVTMQARARNESPDIGISRMQIVDEKGPVYTYSTKNGVDFWTVEKRALGKGGARWLPVRSPGAYAAEAFRSIAKARSIALPRPERIETVPDSTAFARIDSAPLATMLRDMLKYSTNLTAEITGIAAASTTGMPPGTLWGSGRRMSHWAAQEFGAETMRFADHSGLGYGSRISAADMAAILAQNHDGALPSLLKEVTLATKDGPGLARGRAHAKTGTLNFVSALAGYIHEQGRPLAFAIFTADEDRRDAIPVAMRERPEGARGWNNRSRRLQKDLLRLWGKSYTA